MTKYLVMTGVTVQPSGAMSKRVSASMMTLVLVALCLRTWSRLKTHRHFLIEDLLILLAAALFYADQGLFLYATMGNGASGAVEAETMTLAQLNRYTRYLFAQEILFVICITVVKLSILFFYRHIFTVDVFLRINWGLMAACASWGIITTFFVIFQFSPVHALWHYEMQLSGQATCISPPKMIFGFEVTNVAVDIMVLLPPVSMVQRLKLKAAKRAFVTGIILLGLFVCVTCIVRAHFIWNPITDQARNLAAAMDWTTVELASAIVCACLPTYGPLISGASNISIGIRSWYSSLRSSLRKSSPSSSGGSRSKPFSKSNQITLAHAEYHQLEEGIARNPRSETLVGGTEVAPIGRGGQRSTPASFSTGPDQDH